MIACVFVSIFIFIDNIWTNCVVTLRKGLIACVFVPLCMCHPKERFYIISVSVFQYLYLLITFGSNCVYVTLRKGMIACVFVPLCIFIDNIWTNCVWHPKEWFYIMCISVFQYLYLLITFGQIVSVTIRKSCI